MYNIICGWIVRILVTAWFVLVVYDIAWAERKDFMVTVKCDDHWRTRQITWLEFMKDQFRHPFSKENIRFYLIILLTIAAMFWVWLNV